MHSLRLLACVLLLGATTAACAASPPRSDAPAAVAHASPSPPAASGRSDRVCALFSPSAIDAGFTDVTAFALTTRVTCVISHGELACVDLFGSAPRTFAKHVLAVAGGKRIVAVLEGGALALSPAVEGMPLDGRAVRRAVAAWGRTPTAVTHFENLLTLFDDRGESRRFLLLRDGLSEIAVARDPSFPIVRQATVSTSAFFDEHECVLVGDVEQCRADHENFGPVHHPKPVKAIGGNCAVLADDTVSCFGSSLDAPTGVGSVPGAVAVSSSDVTTGACAIDATGRVVCLGDLGVGFTPRGVSPFASPHVVEGIEGAVSLTVLDGRACALGKDGHLRCFGCVRAHPAMASLARPNFPTEVEPPAGP